MKIIAIGSAVIAIIAIVYALVQKGVADENIRISYETMRMTEKSKKMADSLRVQLQHCTENGELNRKIAVLQEKRADSLNSLLKRKK